MPAGPPGGPGNPFNMRGGAMRSMGRAGLRLQATSTAATRVTGFHQQHSQSHSAVIHKPHSSAFKPPVAELTAAANLAGQHEHSFSGFKPARTALRKAAVVTPVYAVPVEVNSRKRQPQSNRSSFDYQREGAPLPDQPQLPSRNDESCFLDTFAANLSSAGSSSVEDGSSSSSSSSRGHNSRDSVVPSSSSVQSGQAAPAQPSSVASESVQSSVFTADAAIHQQYLASQSQSPIYAEHDSSAVVPSDSSASSTSPTVDSNTSSIRSSDSMYLNLLFPGRLCGALLGAKGQSTSAMQVPGARWWKANPAQHSGDAAMRDHRSDFRTIVIHGAPPTLAAVVAKIVAQATSASAAPAIQNVFRHRDGKKQGWLKVVLRLESWLVGTVLGKSGQTVKQIEAQSGGRLKVGQMEGLRLVPGAPRRQVSPQSFASLMIAGPSLTSIVNAVQLVAEAIQRNPKYKPVAYREAV
mmetsp:Transcript_14643/g.44246  ORF Transcript_14643/g.44246 Transcript_14643/m.44246 type:complete len:466 (-) Transcript_14643:1254-2651(-)|eukprot:CAMPEP_0206134576 /NCGR_PEP_ID=MMETSP1473-20131121/89_1 /ASSEMBLY_ACC=CAM_ASM_001109 /TAXON_ID=1461547 /ORGANISM="Stichococcus sp, Strain RCC1054" /LENGTH=465 /DNA_ID=CAMNT_0053526191 /DNA_START=146 /DNA_END=1543 /DNA_ORIENTATION=+